MRVLGIDPGTVSTGYGIIEEKENRLKYIKCGGILLHSKLSFPEKLKKIYDCLREVIEEYSPDIVCVEDLFFAKNVKSVLKLGHARGVAILAAVNTGLPVFEYTPLEVKKAVVGYGRADKAQVQHMVKALLNLGESIFSNDATDALAIAICHVHSIKLEEKIKVV